MRELLSNSLPSGSWDQVLEYVSDKVITQKSPQVRGTSRIQNRTSQNTAEAMKTRARTALTKNVRDQVLNRDQCCQYQDPHTKQLCGSKWHLHVDHIQPVWANGSNDVQNLRALCANHNLEIYRKQAGMFQRF